MEVNRKIRSKKLSTRVDLTAMVSVSFLLIIFFMVSIELRKPNSLDYPTYANECGDTFGCNNPDENRTMTVLLGENNKIVTYCGLISFQIGCPKEIDYSKTGIRKELLERNKLVLQYSANRGRPGLGVKLIIKPSKKCNYGNLVSILDEMKICSIDSYYIVDYYTPEETKLLAMK